MKPRASACFRAAPRKQSFGGSLEAGALWREEVEGRGVFQKNLFFFFFPEERTRQVLGAIQRRRVGLLVVGRTSRVQFW